MKTNRWVRTLGLVLISAVVLAACSGAGAGNDNPPDLSGVQIAELSTTALIEMSELDVNTATYTTTVGLAASAQAWLYLYDSWGDLPAVDGYTFTQEQDGNAYCLTISDGVTVIQICVTDTGSDWLLEVRIDGSLLLEGNIAYDGQSGDLRLIAGGSTEYRYRWEPTSSGPYAYSFYAEIYEPDIASGSITEYLYVDTSADGTFGAWEVDDGETTNSGTWGS